MRYLAAIALVAIPTLAASQAGDAPLEGRWEVTVTLRQTTCPNEDYATRSQLWDVREDGEWLTVSAPANDNLPTRWSGQAFGQQSLTSGSHRLQIHGVARKSFSGEMLGAWRTQSGACGAVYNVYGTRLKRLGR